VNAPKDVVRTLRFWAVTDGVYGAAVAYMSILAVPWKTPAINVLAMFYGAAVIMGAPFLATGARWAYRLAIATSLAGLAGAVLAITGLVASWAYLRAIYGPFGAGAALVSLFIAGCVFQVLGLYPALRLRALWRSDMRAQLGDGASSPPSAILVIILCVSLPAVAGATVAARYGIGAAPAIDPKAAHAALAAVRSRLEGHAFTHHLPALTSLPPGEGPLYVSLVAGGETIATSAGEGETLAAAVWEAAETLAQNPGAVSQARAGRLRLDRTIGRAALGATSGLWLALGLDPGRDGLRSLPPDPAATKGVPPSPPLVLLPGDLVQAQIFGATPLLPFLHELRLGADTAWLADRLAPPDPPPGEEARPSDTHEDAAGGGKNGVDDDKGAAAAGDDGDASDAEAPGVTPVAFERLRFESWIECPRGACRLVRGGTALDDETLPALRTAMNEAGAYIVRRQGPDGTFDYVYDPVIGESLPSSYSLPRHAGTVYSLSQLAGFTRNPTVAAAAANGLVWMFSHVFFACGHPGADFACVREAERARLGTTALMVIAVLQYRHAMGEFRHDPLARALGGFLLAMQKSNGDFHHVYLPGKKAVDLSAAPQMFASEEAALALVMLARDLGDPAFLRAAERALDHLTGPKYDFFLGRFTFGVDSWTCMAAEAAAELPSLRHRRYLDFCLGYSAFLTRLQFDADAPEGFAGHYGFSPLMVPQAPATAGFSEAMGAVANLARHHGRPDSALERHLVRGLFALARDQIRPGNDHVARNPAEARGGIRRSLVESQIRIDFVQHALSALLRGVSLIEAGVQPVRDNAARSAQKPG
jgi:hypothetical protein